MSSPNEASGSASCNYITKCICPWVEACTHSGQRDDCARKRRLSNLTVWLAGFCHPRACFVGIKLEYCGTRPSRHQQVLVARYDWMLLAGCRRRVANARGRIFLSYFLSSFFLALAKLNVNTNVPRCASPCRQSSRFMSAGDRIVP